MLQLLANGVGYRVSGTSFERLRPYAPEPFLLPHNVVAYVALLLRHDSHPPHDPGVRFTFSFLQRLWHATFLQHV